MLAALLLPWEEGGPSSTRIQGLHPLPSGGGPPAHSLALLPAENQPCPYWPSRSIAIIFSSSPCFVPSPVLSVHIYARAVLLPSLGYVLLEEAEAQRGELNHPSCTANKW